MYSSGVPSGVAVQVSIETFIPVWIIHTVLSIDFACNSTQLRFQLLILLDIFATWHGDLNEYDLVAQLGMVVQECVEPLQLLRETLYMVESVHAYDDLDVFVLLLQHLDALLHFGLG